MAKNIIKTGRNEPCPCGSGMKYKKCHGGIPELPNIPKRPPNPEHDLIIAGILAKEKQRKQQQGLGNRIISFEHQSGRFVAVRNKLYYSEKYKTFHDFLFGYIGSVFGEDWGNAELKKPLQDRHPLLQWYDLVCKFQRENMDDTKGVQSAPATGAAEAYLQLSYNLYILEHNEKIQDVLVRRLKNNDQFHGALYETHVAAILIRAGFELSFEDESDGSRSHCEFTATNQKTGGMFSVEVKARQLGKDHFDVGNQLYEALKKEAEYKRIVFIDLNVADRANIEICLMEAVQSMRDRERSLTIQGDPAPSAYVIITNDPYQYSLESTDFRSAGVVEGFKMPDFRYDSIYRSIGEALAARKRHLEITELLDSMKTHHRIPSTFDGEIPELEFDDSIPRLQIGHIYLVPDEEKENPAQLIDASVDEKQQLAYCIFKFEDGRTHIMTAPLTDNEITAYRRHPDTFFGIDKHVSKKNKNPLEMYDFLFQTYKSTPKEKLLEFMKNNPDYETLQNETQEKLAEIYCEGLLNSILSKNH